MTTAQGVMQGWQLPPPAPVTVFVGNYGSGKTEIAINYALGLAASGEPVRLVDLDIVNPYFRSREARDFAERHGVQVVAPRAELAFADLPIVLREVEGAVRSPAAKVVLDVGGDDLGARVLGGFSHQLGAERAAVLQVVNQRRPFTETPEACRRMHAALEAASRLRVTGLVANAHLMADTSPQVVLDGIAMTRAFGQEIGVPLVFAAVERRWVAAIEAAAPGLPVLPLDRFMTSPWDISPRRGPIGRPPPTTLPPGVR